MRSDREWDVTDFERGPSPDEAWAEFFDTRMPEERLSRLIAGVRSAPVTPITPEELQRRREAEGDDCGCLCCGDPNCYFREENVS